MFDLDTWLSSQEDYEKAVLLGKKSAKLSLNNTAVHKLKWGLDQKDDYFLRKEAVWLKRIHPHSFFIHSLIYEGQFLLLLEYIHGESLSKVLQGSKQRSLFTANKRAQFLQSLFESVKELHERGIVHGDLKAANVILVNETEARLIDFAAASWIGSDNTIKPYIMKTPSYALPESIEQAKVLAIIDWYAFFIIFDLLHFMTPVTLKTHSLSDYIAFHDKQLAESLVELEIKQQLKQKLDEVQYHFRT